MGKDQRVLFHQTVFGPIHSRRLGVSLGVNLSPVDGKVCSFDCLYCEAGFNSQGPGNAGLPARETVKAELRSRLEQMKAEGVHPDVITFSGNGEPTVHPDFAGIVDDTLALRDELCPQAKVSVLTNSTMLHKLEVVNALLKVDNNILKLDSAIDSTMRRLDRPGAADFTVGKAVDGLRQFAGTGIVQTMMLRGEYGGEPVDNTTEEEICALEAAYRAISPRAIMLYSIDRSTPAEQLQKIDAEELSAIGRRIEAETGIHVQVN